LVVVDTVVTTAAATGRPLLPLLLVLPPGALEAKTRAAAEKASLALAVAGGEDGLPRPGEVVGLASAKIEGPSRIGKRRRPITTRRRRETDKEDGDNLEME